ncbi:phosphoglucosamine mutase [Eggerthellaceae bacterium zg-1084]|uniref:phosphoglucosamine mutase n=1 Tax=Berryella wangjianweii TaxID=2734634 RepID=UPI0015525317|nr:phosphoglucosamine mutase [Berryella wangjianweii]NPD30490.1 phosphoglucosamine mutase [Berryella wangjianweii]
MGRLFGTDGVRGVANSQLTCKIAFDMGRAAVHELGPCVVIGKDTRRSGDMLESAAAAGVMAAGGTALIAGVIPTPAVAVLTRQLGADAGMVISASHNPPEYNGIKLFDAAGFKLPDAAEGRIEALVTGEASFKEAARAAGCAEALPTGAGVGTRRDIPDAVQRYVDHVVEGVRAQNVSFEGLHIALDAGHGASCRTSPLAFESLGARVSVINADYDGDDINVNCGSTHLEPLERLMRESGADIGVAHDGDADRVMLMTPAGEVLDGDVVEAVCALDLHGRGLLAHDTVVSTVMCNLGFVRAMEDAGISVVQTAVGDRSVLERMREDGYRLGGEQSGHLIMLDCNSTGDGLASACQFIAAVLRRGKGFAEAASVMRRYPQTLVNVRVSRKEGLADCAAVWDEVRAVERQLGRSGRVLVRTSGTEPLVRVMVEAADQAVATEAANRIARVAESLL